MDFITILILLVILVETTILVLRKTTKPLRSHNKRKIFIDTSVLMDGRILAVAETGFLSDDLIIPRSVLNELQLLADGKDSEKRARARYGLDIASSLERVEHLDTTILYDDLDRTPVDNRLMELAKTEGGYIMTNDFNLNKVALAQGISVLNINDLAIVLRGEYLPGEHTVARISAVGSNARQGIGYLSDGTMLVVENASDKVGQEVEVEFTRYIQTSAGKMIFGKIVEPVKNPRELKRVSGRAAKSSDNKISKFPRNSAEAEDELMKLLTTSEADFATLDRATSVEYKDNTTARDHSQQTIGKQNAKKGLKTHRKSEKGTERSVERKNSRLRSRRNSNK